MHFNWVANMDLDLNTLDLKELKALQAKLTKAISTFEERRKKDALVQLEEKARELGFASLSELTGAQVARKRAASTVVYANPENLEETWSGRGRKPRWFLDAVAKGLSAEDMLLN